MDLKSINEIPMEVTTLDDNECNQNQVILDHQQNLIYNMKIKTVKQNQWN